MRPLTCSSYGRVGLLRSGHACLDIWDASLPVGSVHTSQKTSTVTFIVVHTGKAQLGQWVTERRNVREDYRMVYGEEPDNPPVIALSIDTNDT